MPASLSGFYVVAINLIEYMTFLFKLCLHLASDTEFLIFPHTYLLHLQSYAAASWFC